MANLLKIINKKLFTLMLLMGTIWFIIIIQFLGHFCLNKIRIIFNNKCFFLNINQFRYWQSFNLLWNLIIFNLMTIKHNVISQFNTKRQWLTLYFSGSMTKIRKWRQYKQLYWSDNVRWERSRTMKFFSLIYLNNEKLIK